MGVVVALALSACGPPGPLFLTIECDRGGSPLAIPDEVDQVSVVVLGAPGGETLFEKRYPLDPAQHRFPLSLALETGAKTPFEVSVRVAVEKQDLVLASSEAKAALYSQQVNQLTIRVLVPSP